VKVKKINQLTILEEIKRPKYKYYLKCECDCGNIKTIEKYKVLNGHIKSCGCYRKRYMKDKKTSHGWARTRLYQCYKHMMERCYHEHDQAYDNYGG